MSSTGTAELCAAVAELDRRFRAVAAGIDLDHPPADVDPIAVLEAQRSLDRFSFLVRSLVGELPRPG